MKKLYTTIMLMLVSLVFAMGQTPGRPFNPILYPQEHVLTRGYITALTLEANPYNGETNLDNECYLYVNDTVDVHFMNPLLSLAETAHTQTYGNDLFLDIDLYEENNGALTQLAALPFNAEVPALNTYIRPTYERQDSVIIKLPPGRYYMKYHGCYAERDHEDLQPLSSSLSIISSVWLRLACIPLITNDEHIEIQDWNHIVNRKSKNGSIRPGSYMETVRWLDDFGRLESTHALAMSPSGKTIADLTEYDNAGRVLKRWLPSAMETQILHLPYLGNINTDGHVDVDTLKQLSVLLNSDECPYEQTSYASVLEKPVLKVGPGQNWYNGNHGVWMQYNTNSDTDDKLKCRHINVLTATNDTTFFFSSNALYTPGSIKVTSSFDEDNQETLQFKDRLGRVVLSRQVIANETSVSYLDTYMCYDGLDRLVAVIPPALSSQFETGSHLSEVEINRYAYLYKYDQKGRQCAKKLPGCAWMLMCYDKADRMVLSQDGVQRQNGKATFYLYDVMGRECVSGTCTCSIQLGAMVESFVRADYSGSSVAMGGYVFNGITLSNPQVTEIIYYDGYSFLTDFNTGLPDQSPAFGLCIPSTSGRVTGKCAYLLSGDTIANSCVWSVFKYDVRGRESHSESSFPGGKVTVSDTEYNFLGNPVHRHVSHNYTRDSGTESKVEDTYYSYDHAERLVSVTHSLDGGPEMVLSANAYDEVGRIVEVQRGNSANLTSTYSYNVRSAISDIGGNLFSEHLYYETPRHTDATGLNVYFNGRLSAMKWKTRTDYAYRFYDFSYDGAGRLKDANYGEDNALQSGYGSHASYDSMGNITRLSEEQGPNGAYPAMQWTYDGNHLIKKYGSGIQYTYDANGNMTSDLVKGISRIAYNTNNQPAEIVSAVGIEQFVYLADGTKYSRQFTPVEGDNKLTEYVGNAVFENSVLKYLLFDGGMIDFSDNGVGQYVFFIKDHLGSTRIVADANGLVAQTNNYYPYGMSYASNAMVSLPTIGGGHILPLDPFPGGNSFEVNIPGKMQPYKFGGNELYTDSGLNLYDFKARMYDPTIGRFTSMDPKAEKYFSISPYAYCNNNPVIFVDPDGKVARVVLGALTGALVEMAIALYQEKSIEEVGVAAIVGAIEGGIGAATFGFGGQLVKAGVKEVVGAALKGAVGSAAGSIFEQAVSDGEVDFEQVGKDAAWGAAFGGLDGGITFSMDGKLSKAFQSRINRNSIWNDTKKDFRSNGLPTNHKAISREVQSRIELEQAAMEDVAEASEMMGLTTLNAGLDEIKNKVTGK